VYYTTVADYQRLQCDAMIRPQNW